MWSDEGKDRLWKLHIDPARHSREDLIALVQHFKKNGTLFSVTDKGKPVLKSQEFARKVRELGSVDIVIATI